MKHFQYSVFIRETSLRLPKAKKFAKIKENKVKNYAL